VIGENASLALTCPQDVHPVGVIWKFINYNNALAYVAWGSSLLHD
jgi:hypothetical protein